MQVQVLRRNARSKPKKQPRNKRGHRISTLKRTYSLLTYTLKVQLPMVLALVGSDLLMRQSAVSTSIVVLVVLSVLIYIAQTAGIRQAMISSALVVAYNYYIIVASAPEAGFTFHTLRNGLVISVAFPGLAFVIGRLKEKNDALLLAETTARKKAEKSEQELRFVAESMPQKIFTLKPHGEIDYVNPQWSEYIGKGDSQTVGRYWEKMIHPEDAHENTELWQQSLETGKPFVFEHRLKRGDGKYIWHITRANALRNEHGEITGWIGSSTDIEDIRKTRRLEASTAKLIKQRTQLMELNNAKDEFISLASHQLRTPATGVKQYINMALDGFGGPVPQKLRILLEKANESNERQLSVINDLLQVAQMDAGKVVLRKTEVEVGKLITDVIREQKSKFNHRNQNITFRNPKTKLRVLADATKLRMVIENVIDNASKYTPHGKNLMVSLSKSHGMAHIAIKDEGVGISPGDINKIFNKFVRLDNPMSTEVGGTGLGLYWVQKVVELHNGSISVDSTVDKGSTFLISLHLS